MTHTDVRPSERLRTLKARQQQQAEEDRERDLAERAAIRQKLDEAKAQAEKDRMLALAIQNNMVKCVERIAVAFERIATVLESKGEWRDKL